MAEGGGLDRVGAPHPTGDPGGEHRVTGPGDVDAVRFDTSPRGYRMDEVDARLEALRDDLSERERTLRSLRPPAEDG